MRVPPDERTCCGCGDTFPADGFCYRCRLDNKGKVRMDRQPPSVPTLSYLREGEWEKAQ